MSLNLKANIDIDDPSTPLKAYLDTIRHENSKFRSVIMRQILDPQSSNQLDKSHITTALTNLMKAQNNLAQWHKLLMKYLRRTDQQDKELNVYLGRDNLLKGTKQGTTKQPLIKSMTKSLTTIFSPKPHSNPRLSAAWGTKKHNQPKTQTFLSTGGDAKNHMRVSGLSVSPKRRKLAGGTRHLKINGTHTKSICDFGQSSQV
jgi:hypothetical protein